MAADAITPRVRGRYVQTESIRKLEHFIRIQASLCKLEGTRDIGSSRLSHHAMLDDLGPEPWNEAVEARTQSSRSARMSADDGCC